MPNLERETIGNIAGVSPAADITRQGVAYISIGGLVLIVASIVMMTIPTIVNPVYTVTEKDESGKDVEKSLEVERRLENSITLISSVGGVLGTITGGIIGFYFGKESGS